MNISKQEQRVLHAGRRSGFQEKFGLRHLLQGRRTYRVWALTSNILNHLLPLSLHPRYP